MTEPRWNAKHLAAWDYLLLHPEGVEVPRMAAHMGWSRQATTDRLDALYVRDKATRDPSPIRGRPHVYHAVRSAAPPSPSIPRVRNRPSVSQRRPKAVPPKSYEPKPYTAQENRGFPDIDPARMAAVVDEVIARDPGYAAKPPTRQPLPVPPLAHCMCDCLGREHWTDWGENGRTFGGTRCEAHGGHKFAFVIAEPSDELRCELCPEPVEGAERFCPTHLAIYTRLTQ